jgi:hypothetical protein
VECVFDQTLPTWIALHGHAVTLCGGVPPRVVRDDRKAGSVQAWWDDPQGQRPDRACAEPDGVLRAPGRPRTPEHTGQVEPGGVHSGTRPVWGGRAPPPIPQAKVEVRHGCRTTAGRRGHGTTKAPPRHRFETAERAPLKPPPAGRDELAVWTRGTGHRDCDVVVAQASSSAPCRLLGQARWGRGGSQEVRRETVRSEVVAPHPRATRAGARVTPPARGRPGRLCGPPRSGWASGREVP